MSASGSGDQGCAPTIPIPKPPPTSAERPVGQGPVRPHAGDQPMNGSGGIVLPGPFSHCPHGAEGDQALQLRAASHLDAPRLSPVLQLPWLLEVFSGRKPAPSGHGKEH